MSRKLTKLEIARDGMFMWADEYCLLLEDTGTSAAERVAARKMWLALGAEFMRVTGRTGEKREPGLTRILFSDEELSEMLKKHGTATDAGALGFGRLVASGPGYVERPSRKEPGALEITYLPAGFLLVEDVNTGERTMIPASAVESVERFPA
jgi:hypothetical protein